MSGRAGGIVPQAVIMAGGEGRRLGELTAQVPKPMLRIGDRPLLQQQIEQLRDQGVVRITLAVGYRADTIIDYFGNGESLGVHLHYVVEGEPLGTAGGLGLLDPWPGPLLVLNGDIVADIPVHALLRHHEECRADITLGCTPYEMPVPYGVVDGSYPFVTTLRETPAITLMVNAGVYVLSPFVHDFLRPVRRLHVPELVDELLAGGRVASYRLPGPWIDIGTPERYALACSQLSESGGPPPSDSNVVGEQPVPARVGSLQVTAAAIGDRRNQ